MTGKHASSQGRRDNRRETKTLQNKQIYIDEGVLRWFGHVERMGNDRIVAKRVYVGECLPSRANVRESKEVISVGGLSRDA